MTDALSTLANASGVLQEAKSFFEAEKKALEDKMLGMQLELELHKSAAIEARSAQAHAERVATKLLTQFAMVEQIFADVKRQALTLAEHEATESTPLPSNELPGTNSNV